MKARNSITELLERCIVVGTRIERTMTQDADELNSVVAELREASGGFPPESMWDAAPLKDRVKMIKTLCTVLSATRPNSTP